MRQKQLVCGAAKAPHQTVALGDIVFASSVALHSLVLRHTGTWGIHKVLRLQSCCKQTSRIHYSCKRRICSKKHSSSKVKVQFSTCCFLRVRLTSTYPITRCHSLKRIQKMLRSLVQGPDSHRLSPVPNESWTPKAAHDGFRIWYL